MTIQDVITKIDSLEIDDPNAEELRAAAIAFARAIDDPEIWDYLDEERGISWGAEFPDGLAFADELSFEWKDTPFSHRARADVWIDDYIPKVTTGGSFAPRELAGGKSKFVIPRFETFPISKPNKYKPFLTGLLLGEK